MKPKNNPIAYGVKVYLTKAELNELENLCRLTRKTKSALIRYAIREALLNAEILSFPET